MSNIKILLVTLPFLLHLCTDKQPKIISQKIENPKTIEKTMLSEVFTDTFEFISYNDDGDYWVLNAQKGNEIFAFIYDDSDEPLLRGDLCEIRWKKDTIYLAGEDDTPELADVVVQITKTKNGKVSDFRQMYLPKLNCHYSDEHYSQSYLDKIYLLVEYYIANSVSDPIQQAIRNQTPISYSIERQTLNQTDYEVLEITCQNAPNWSQRIYLHTQEQNLYLYNQETEQFVLF